MTQKILTKNINKISIISEEEIVSPISNQEIIMNEKTCPILRNSKNQYAPLERLFGTLDIGMSFGEFAVAKEAKRKFYEAITLTDCLCFVISRLDFEMSLKEVEKKSVNEKIVFLKTIPEFNHISLSRNKL